jgi:phage gp45-like
MTFDVDALIRRVKMMFSLGRVQLTDDTGPVQLHQVDMGPHLKHFGFASNPPVGSDVFVGFLRGDRSSGVVLGSNHQPSRLKNLQPGDAALYDERGAYVWLGPNGPVINGAGLDLTVQNVSAVNVTAPAGASITGSVDVTDNLSVASGMTGVFTVSGQIVTVKDGVGLNIAPAGTLDGAELVNAQYFTNLTNRVNALETCADLQALAAKELASLSGIKQAIDAELARLAPYAALLTAPGASPSAIVTWITNFISAELEPKYQASLSYAAQLTALTTAVTNLTTAIEQKAAQFESCTLSLPGF